MVKASAAAGVPEQEQAEAAAAAATGQRTGRGLAAFVVMSG